MFPSLGFPYYLWDHDVPRCTIVAVWITWGFVQILPNSLCFIYSSFQISSQNSPYSIKAFIGSQIWKRILRNGEVSAQPHTIVKQICLPNGKVLFLSLFSLFKNWLHNVVWGCAEILPCDWLGTKTAFRQITPSEISLLRAKFTSISIETSAYDTNTISWNFSGEWMCDITWDAPYMLITFRLSMTPLTIWHVLNHTFFMQYSDQVCSCLNPFRISRVNLRRKVCSCSITKSQLIAPVPRHRLRDQAPLTPPVVDDVRSL